MVDEKKLSVTYEDIGIAYDEGADVWRFTLRGRERSAESLAKAKEAIDKPVPADKAKPFQRVKAIQLNYSGQVTFGDVTSIADTPSYREKEVWFQDAKDNKRSKEPISSLYADTPINRQLADEGKALDKEAELLTRKAQGKRAKMARLKIEVPE